MLRHVGITAGLLVVVTAVMYSTAPIEQGTNRPDQQALSKIVSEIEELDALRSGLAATMSGEVDKTTFWQVCRPVGVEAKRFFEENGWQIRQLALKNRNPDNSLDPEAELIYRMMEATPEMMGLWVRTEMNGEAGFRYYRRIEVEASCLVCHGARESRPQFVKDDYPEDRAYNFEPGDLRGIYSVFIADE
jgi:hypothetical protein